MALKFLALIPATAMCLLSLSASAGVGEKPPSRTNPEAERDSPRMEDPDSYGPCTPYPSSYSYKGPDLVVIQAEQWVTSANVQVNGGSVAVQQMSGFGPGWGDRQLFWSGGAVGAVLDATFNAPYAGKLWIEAYMTRAPDYGVVKGEVRRTDQDTGDRASLGTRDLWAPSVKHPGDAPTMIGFGWVQKGKNTLSLMITGKNSQSSGYLVGIDCITLRKMSP